MKATLRICAQYFENYGDSNDPHFKPKGSHIFEVLVDSHLLMYVGHEDLVTVCESIMEKQSNSVVKYKYLSNEVSFGGNVTILKEEEVREELMKHFD